ncbi:maleylpyruvate isomerase family mycothiol-dependent enzyme [Isoptericola sp. b441]|uniref:Maleylpyruvate isomerase family mycothiol-dependent enzyme n=1 Tax=Actinotalea lenta TaxID=3064654 RepID=A0ABT9DBC8_9CELL|nr:MULTISPECIES: maleylpyruvate isomerase family mycothiol-dependent enzyme [unclassified Isoptericola]MDO8108199.1 maleylpyruvate isomerase family mycothiol-dependent enzyme [Isoptericola sp. b441]MDO8120130.1 maleylpyruvate isomerase family mycothiol-dependent enzyme [Isoptericola sp. b490]
MVPTEAAAAIASIERTHDRLRATLEGLTDEAVAGPSRLPGWTRGHVLAHLAGFGAAAERQLLLAVQGAPAVEFYDGGREARDAAIEAGAGASAAQHVERVVAVMDRVEGLLDLLDDEALRQPTGYQGLPAGALVLAWWREFSIHLTDLDLGAEHTLWSPELREHLVGFLSPRVPDGVQLDLEPTDVDEPRRVGQGRVVRVRGTANDLVAWLAGREPLGPVVADAGGETEPLPVLGPWPRPRARIAPEDRSVR